MRQQLKTQPARLGAAGRWLARHWSSLWPLLVITLVIALGAAFIYVVPMQLVHPDNAGTPDSLTKARHDERATLLQSLIGLLALFGAVSALRQLRMTREGQITDRYTKAIDQLDRDRALAVRLGGLYALERIARDSPADRATIAEVLSTYARTAPRDPPTPTSLTSQRLRRPGGVRIPPSWEHLGAEAEPIPASQAVPLEVRAPDVQAAVTILGRWQVRLRESPSAPVDLHGADLEGVNLLGARLQGAFLVGAQLQGALLAYAQLQGASLSDAELQEAILVGAQLQEAYLADAELQGAFLVGAQLQEANLAGARLRKVRLTGAQLQGAFLVGAQLQEAYLADAEMQGASLAGAQLQGADLSRARKLESAVFSFGRPERNALAASQLAPGPPPTALADRTTKWPSGFDWRAVGVELVEG
jgi:uncharacterized protein YjbI with pentapeptide repeats